MISPIIDIALVSLVGMSLIYLAVRYSKSIWRSYVDRHDFIQKYKVLRFIDENSFHILNGLLLHFLLFRNNLVIPVVLALLIFMKPHPNPKVITWSSFREFLKAFVILGTELFVENSLVYLVSYYDDHKFNYKPSQDHIYNILATIFPFWNDFFEAIDPYFQLPGANDYLTVALLWGLAALMKRISANRVDPFTWTSVFMKSLALARVIRTIAFSSTVMPNPRPDCFANKFEMVRDYDHFLDIMATVRTSGCNDLVVSGHTLFICMIIFAVDSAMTGWSVRIIKFIVTPITLINIIMGRHHYSVDVFLGVALSMILWERSLLKNESMFKEIEAREGMANPNEKKGVKKMIAPFMSFRRLFYEI